MTTNLQSLLDFALDATWQAGRITLGYFQNGVAVAWHRVPWTMGCSGGWTDELRAQHYDNMCAIDGRIVLAGEHCSRLPAWQEGAVLSALDAVTRLHRRVLSA